MKFTHREIGNDAYFEVIDAENNRNHYWQEDLVIFFVLEGHCDLLIPGQSHRLEKEDGMIVDQFTPYNLDVGEGGVLLSLHLSTGLFRNYLDIFAGKLIRCSPADQEALEPVKGYLARIFTAFYKGGEDNYLWIYQELTALLGYIDDHFAVPDTHKLRESGEQGRLRRILAFIEKNYTSAISLEEVAKSEYISPGYFSRLFSKNLGQSFSQYLKAIRLAHGHRALLGTGDSVTKIALDCGFANVNLFITAFRESYGLTPGEYRKQQTSSKREAAAPGVEVPENDDFAILSKYLKSEPAAPALTPKKRRKVYQDIDLDRRVKTKDYPQSWRNLLTVGWAKEVLLAPVQEQIRRIQEDIGFEFLRFHGLLDDEMIVYRENEKGEPVYNFTYVDLLFDFILSVGLKPYVEFSYIPSAMAEDKVRFFEHSSIIAIPKDLEKWEELITRLVKHWIERYGVRKVAQWKFVTINGYCVYLGHFTMTEYVRLYEVTYRRVKALLPTAQFGGPGCDIGMLQLRSNTDWEDFFTYCENHHCLPDFISVQCFHAVYSESFAEVNQAAKSHEMPPVHLSSDENYLANTLSDLKHWLKNRGIKGAQILLETWNSTMWQRDFSNDTCFKAAFLAKNIIQNCDGLRGMGFWTLSDFMEELPVEQELFHGGYGLFTYNGIPKSGYYAMVLLNRMGESLLARGENYCVTVKDDKIRIVLYNYCHYDHLYQRKYASVGSPMDRYRIFENKGDLALRFRLTHLEPGTYEIETYSVSQTEGSAFDAWLQMGAPPQLRPSRQDYLKGVSAPAYTVRRETCGQGELEIPVEVKPHQVLTIIINPI